MVGRGEPVASLSGLGLREDRLTLSEQELTASRASSLPSFSLTLATSSELLELCFSRSRLSGCLSNFSLFRYLLLSLSSVFLLFVLAFSPSRLPPLDEDRLLLLLGGEGGEGGGGGEGRRLATRKSLSTGENAEREESPSPVAVAVAVAVAVGLTAVCLLDGGEAVRRRRRSRTSLRSSFLLLLLFFAFLGGSRKWDFFLFFVFMLFISRSRRTCCCSTATTGAKWKERWDTDPGCSDVTQEQLLRVDYRTGRASFEVNICLHHFHSHTSATFVRKCWSLLVALVAVCPLSLFLFTFATKMESRVAK